MVISVRFTALILNCPRLGFKAVFALRSGERWPVVAAGRTSPDISRPPESRLFDRYGMA
jgi:hypothetical protein